MKTNFKFGFVAVIGALLLAACGGATPTAAPAATVAPTEVAVATEAPTVEATAMMTSTEMVTSTEMMTPTMEMTPTEMMSSTEMMTPTMEMSPTEMMSSTEMMTPTMEMSPTEMMSSTEMMTPTMEMSPTEMMSSTEMMTPTMEMSPTEMMSSTEMMTPTMEMTATAMMTASSMMTATPEAMAPLALSKQFKIAIVMPSATTDAAFSQSMFEALKAVQAEVGGEDKLMIAFSENMFNVPDAAAALRDYASQGFDLIIAHGTQYGTSLAEIAPDFPETSFAWGTATDTMESKGLKNVFAYQADAQQGGYVLGVLAALTSKSGIIGVSGPVEAGDAKLYIDGFKKGAEAAKPGIKVNVSYTGSFSDISKMTAAAETHVAAGADMLTGSSQSVVGAIGIAKDKKLLWFGTQWDQTSLAPEAVAVSQVYDWKAIIRELISDHVAGTLGGKAFTLTLANGGLKLVYNDAVTLPPEAKAAADKAVADIEAGTVTP